MTHSKEYSTLIIIGSWNIAIFSPDWVSKNLLPGQKLNVEFDLNSINASLRISTENLRLFIVNNKLNLVVLKPTETVFQEIEGIGRQLADFLPHTPVQFFGLNFKFDTGNTERIRDLCGIQDSKEFENLGYSVKSTEIKRSFIRKERILNFTIQMTKEKFSFLFNYHFAVKSLPEFKAKLEEDIILNHQNESIELLDKFYGLTLDV